MHVNITNVLSFWSLSLIEEIRKDFGANSNTMDHKSETRGKASCKKDEDIEVCNDLVFEQTSRFHSTNLWIPFPTYPHRTEILKTELSLLNAGDHIGFRRPYLIWHQAIVIAVDAKKARLQVIHYSKEGSETKEGSRTRVKEEWINVEKETGCLFRFDYPADVLVQNPTKMVIERARSKVGEEGYSFLYNNCQHLATFCKTRVKESPQVHYAKARAFGILGQKINAHIYSNNLKPLPASFDIVMVVLWEMVQCNFDLDYIKSLKKDGYISDKDFKLSVTQCICETVARSSLSVIGNSFGRYIFRCSQSFNEADDLDGFASEVLGAVIGTIGSVAGTAFGMYVGLKLGTYLIG